MRVLALDYGSARCGCALSDPTGTIVTPIELVPRPATRRGLARLEELVRERQVERVVVGLPLSLSGEDSEQTRETRTFAQALSLRLGEGVPVEMHDERGRGFARRRAPARELVGGPVSLIALRSLTWPAATDHSPPANAQRRNASEIGKSAHAAAPDSNPKSPPRPFRLPSCRRSLRKRLSLQLQRSLLLRSRSRSPRSLHHHQFLHPPTATRCSSSDAIACVPGVHRSSAPIDAGEGSTSATAGAAVSG